MNELMIFNNPEFGEIRTVEVNGEPWFVGKDVATALGYSNPRKALADHVDDEDKLQDDGVTIRDPIGRDQHPIVINESGLYSLVLSSKLPGAKRFKRWITSEVIPSIRKHGAYLTPETLEAAIMNPDIMIRLCTVLKEEQDRRKSLEAELDRSKEWYSIKRVARMNGRSHKDFDWRKLKKASERMGYGVRKIFDANYGEVNIYHMKVWESVYPNMEI